MTLLSAKTWDWHFIIHFHDCFLPTEGLSWLNILLGNDSNLLFVIYSVYVMEIYMPIKDVKKIMQGNVLCIHP